MFTRQEITALFLGTKWVAKRADAQLAHAAQEAFAKIYAVLPADLRAESDAIPLLVGMAPAHSDGVDLAVLRQAIQDEMKVLINYSDHAQQTSQRVVWPFGVGYFEQVQVVMAWCELREGFRHFRTDRISNAQVLQTHYPKRRHALLKAWRVEQKIN